MHEFGIALAEYNFGSSFNKLLALEELLTFLSLLLSSYSTIQLLLFSFTVVLKFSAGGCEMPSAGTL